MHAIDSLVFDCGRPPAVSEDDRAGGHEVQADGADGERGEHDGALGIYSEGGEGGVPSGRAHGTVDADEVVASWGEGGADDVEEGVPLGEDDGFAGRILFAGGVEDGEKRFDLGAGRFRVHVGGGGGRFSEMNCRTDEGVEVKGFRAAHGASMLGLDDTFDTFVAEGVGTGCYDRIVEGL